ncbi:DUF3307 domain-containing protein [Actinomadura sp. WAC 06369]|uniref:DUF3307 domain-containing protein n=1 Tax=Actinomadura sp. WAC 06369 TaxID=2203193 RepID=UPI000F7A306A|nr:DUF3307 domain-containing protein [Actinomadura sp. WAC 06369]RSN51119.1 transcriptional regulator [Actinomadura sp. WAC 06369]
MTTTTPEARAARAALLFAAFYAAHEVGDHWIQRHGDALAKGQPGAEGRAACARHVATLTAAKAAAAAAAVAVTGMRVRPGRLAGAMLADALSHYVIDRRRPLARLADRVGKTEFYELGSGTAAPCGTGAYALDQSAHITALWVAAITAAR